MKLSIVSAVKYLLIIPKIILKLLIDTRLTVTIQLATVNSPGKKEKLQKKICNNKLENMLRKLYFLGC